VTVFGGSDSCVAQVRLLRQEFWNSVDNKFSHPKFQVAIEIPHWDDFIKYLFAVLLYMESRESAFCLWWFICLCEYVTLPIIPARNCLEECNLDLIVSAVSLFAQRLLCIWRWHFFRLQQKQEVMSNIRGMFVMLLEQKANLHGFVLHSNRLVQLLTHSYLLWCIGDWLSSAGVSVVWRYAVSGSRRKHITADLHKTSVPFTFSVIAVCFCPRVNNQGVWLHAYKKFAAVLWVIFSRTVLCML